jgi:hypothetical protein
MPASESELKVARSWIGTSEDDATFNERYDRLGSLDSAITESLRAQLAVLVLDQPASISTPDGTSASFASNIQALQEQLKLFLEVGSDIESLAPSVVKIFRPSYR